MNSNSSLLMRALKMNAAFSGLSAIALLLAAVALAAYLLSFGIGFFEASLLALINIDLYRATETGHADLANERVDTASTTPFRLGRRRIAAGLLAGTVISFVLLSLQVQQLDLETRTEIIAHRGASFAAPENTLAAVEAAIEAGADDVQSGEEGHTITCAFEAIGEVSAALESALGEAESVKPVWKPQTSTDVDEEKAGTLMKLIEALEDDDDVQNVYANFEISDEVMAKLAEA